MIASKRWATSTLGSLLLALLSLTPASADSLSLQRLSRLGGPIQKIWNASLDCRPYLLAASDSDFIVIDATDSSRTLEVGRIGLGGKAEDVYAEGRHAHVILSGSGWRIVDLANPYQPEILASLDSIADPVAVTGTGRYSYLADRKEGIFVIQWMPAGPPSRHRFLEGTTGMVRRMLIRGNRLYVATDALGVLIFDLTNLEAPRMVGEIPVVAHDLSIAAPGNFAYVLDTKGPLKN